MKRDGWKECTLGDICKDIFAGGDVPKTVFSKEKTENCCIPVFSNGVENDGLYGYTDIPRVVEPCVTISGRGTIGHTVLRSAPFFPIIRLISAIPKDDVDIRYFFYAISNTRFKSTGVTIPQLTVPAVKSYRFCYPVSKFEQQRIVDELDLLSRVIELKNAQLRTLDELAQSIFYEIFGNPVSNEKGWDTLKMKVVAPQKGYSGNIPMHNGKQWLLNLDMVESQTGQILEKVLLPPSEIGNSTTTFNEENVLYSKLRPYLNKVVIPDEPGYCTSELVPLLPDKEKLNRVFLAYLLRSKFFVEYINTRVAGAKMPRVSMSDFRDFDVILPQYTLQESFSERISTIERQKRIIKNSMLVAQDLLASRMDKYFNE